MCSPLESTLREPGGGESRSPQRGEAPARHAQVPEKRPTICYCLWRAVNERVNERIFVFRDRASRIAHHLPTICEV